MQLCRSLDSDPVVLVNVSQLVHLGQEYCESDISRSRLVPFGHNPFIIDETVSRLPVNGPRLVYLAVRVFTGCWFSGTEEPNKIRVITPQG